MKLPIIPSFCIVFAITLAAQGQIQTRLGDVEDKRTTRDSGGGLDVHVRVFGDGLDDAVSMRATVKAAVDDTGRDLIRGGKVESDEGENGFEKIEEGESSEVQLSLKNPARKALTVKEISGEIALFEPKQDPDATIVVPDFQKTGGKPVESPGLKGAGIEIIAYTKEQYEKARKEQTGKAAEEEKKNPGQDMEETMAKAFGELFSMGGGGPNDITLQINDPNQKVVDVEFQRADGKKIETDGDNYSSEEGKTTKICNFRTKLPADARLVIYLSTPKSMVSVPFSLKDVPLP